MPYCFKQRNIKNYKKNKKLKNLQKNNTDTSTSRQAATVEIGKNNKKNRTRDIKQIEITDFKAATHFLIDIITLIPETQEMVYDCYGTSLTVRVINTHTHSYVYAEIDNYFVPTKGAPIVLAAQASAGDTNFYYNAPNHIVNIALTATITKVESAISPRHKSNVIKLIKNLPKEKISGEHHIHFTAQEVWSTLNDDDKEYVKRTLLVPETFSTSAVAGMILWLSQCPHHMRALISQTQLFSMPCYKTFSKLGKAISTKAKSLQNLQTEDLRVIFELDTLVNRITGTVDWHAEKENRTKPVLANINPDYVYEVATKLFSQQTGEAEPARRLKWDDFWANRWQWTASGSYHSQYVEDQQYKFKDQQLRNKFIASIAMPTLDKEHFTSRPPEIQAWSSVKYEWGKQRAIYGTDFTSYVLTHFLFYNAEDTLGAQFPVGNKARPSYVSAKVAAMLERGLHYCLDFEDFNSQHSNSSMKAVLRAWVDAQQHNLHPDQLEVADWVIASIDNTTINDHIGLKESYKTKGTLMSGWRLTTFVNSVLNYIYTTTLVQGSEDTIYSLHNGDDVIMTFNKLSTLRNMQQQCARFNIRAQPFKSHYGAIAEFLRVDHLRGEHGQYLSRNISTLVHGRIESKKAITAVDAIDALESRLAEYLMRGGSKESAARLRQIYYKQIGEIYRTPTSSLYIVKNTHAVAGGISSRENASIDNIITKNELPIEIELPPQLPGVTDYALQIQKTLELDDIPIEKIVKRVEAATLGAIKLVRSSLRIRKNTNRSQYIVYRGIYKAYAELNKDANMGKALMTGFAIEVAGKRFALNTLASAVHAARDKMKYLSIVL